MVSPSSATRWPKPSQAAPSADRSLASSTAVSAQAVVVPKTMATAAATTVRTTDNLNLVVPSLWWALSAWAGSTFLGMAYPQRLGGAYAGRTSARRRALDSFGPVSVDACFLGTSVEFSLWCLVDHLGQLGEMPLDQALRWKHGIFGLMVLWGLEAGELVTTADSR